MAKTDLPLALMGRLIKKAGANRVSEDAKIALAEVLEDVAKETSKRAATIAAKSRRKTLKSEDIRQAVKEVWG
jgi:histone H3/H4